MNNHIQNELTDLKSSLVSRVSGRPFSVPVNYFEELPQLILNRIRTEGKEAGDELQTISPLLAGLSRTSPYEIPEGYFSNVSIPEKKSTAKVVSFSRKIWIRYSAAAILLGVIATTVVFSLNKQRVDPRKDSYSWVQKNLKPVSTDAIEQFNELTDATLQQKEMVAEAGKSVEVKELMKDISDTEIEKFLQEIPAEDASSGMDEIMLN